MKRLMVTGSRTWTNEYLMEQILRSAWVYLEGHKQGIVLVHGGAAGADTMADTIWRRDEGSTVEVHRPDKALGRGATFDRNITMARSGVDLCVAFAMPCTQGAACFREGLWHFTHGTEHAAGAARAEGVPVWLIGAWG